MDRQYIIKTGDETWKVKSNSPLNAVIAAFKKRAPKSPGLLVEVSCDGEEDTYCSTVHCLKAAGYKVET